MKLTGTAEEIRNLIIRPTQEELHRQPAGDWYELRLNGEVIQQGFIRGTVRLSVLQGKTLLAADLIELSIT